MNENYKVVGVDCVSPAHVMRGTLKLFTEVQVGDANVNGSFDRKVFKRVTLATYYGVKSNVDFKRQVAKFMSLNPAMKNCDIHYEYVIREFG
jgi:hypothetical protein